MSREFYQTTFFDLVFFVNGHSHRQVFFGVVLKLLSTFLVSTAVLFSASACAAEPPASEAVSQSYSSIYWSDADSGRLGDLKFRLANKDAPETGSLKQRGGAKCEAERELGYAAKEYIVEFTKNKEVRIERDYGEDRYGRLVVDLSADGVDVANSGVDAGHLRDWPHKNGRALKPKPDWCAP